MENYRWLAIGDMLCDDNERGGQAWEVEGLISGGTGLLEFRIAVLRREPTAQGSIGQCQIVIQVPARLVDNCANHRATAIYEAERETRVTPETTPREELERQFGTPFQPKGAVVREGDVDGKTGDKAWLFKNNGQKVAVALGDDEVYVGHRTTCLRIIDVPRY